LGWILKLDSGSILERELGIKQNKWLFSNHLDFPPPFSYNPARIEGFPARSLSTHPSLYPFRVARRSHGLEVRIDPISEEEVGFLLFYQENKKI